MSSGRGPAGQLHVLIVIKGLGLGGAERLVVEQVKRGRADDVRYTVAYVRPDKTHFVADLEASGAEVVALRPEGRTVWPVELARLVRRLRPDIVHSHSPLPASAARLLVAARLGGVRHHTYTEHNRWQAYRMPTRGLNGLTMGLDAQVWSVSEEARASVWPSRLRRRVEVLHHGIDVGRARIEAGRQAEALRHGPCPGTDGTVLLHIGNRRPEKAHGVLLEAFDRASRDRGELALWLVGQGLDDPAFQAQVRSTTAWDRITVWGYRHDALGLLSRADALVLSSEHEGLPVAVMEALALGRPVVSTSVGGLPEAVRHGREGLLVPRGDVDALADAFRRVADEPATMARMGAAAKERSAVFDAGRAVARQVARYRSLQGRDSPARSVSST